MVKVTGPPKKLLARNNKKNNFFCNTSHYKSKEASLAVIYFAVGDLLSCFQPVFCIWQTMLLQESFENHTPSVEAAAGRVLRTTGDAAACVSSYS